MDTTANKTVEKVPYSEKEIAFRANLITSLDAMYKDRERNHPELDDMTYTEYYESNRKKDLSYIPPKENPNDVRIVSGTTREKDSTLLASLLAMSAEPTVKAFDEEDILINELGENLADLVHKSREMELYDKKRPIIYREMISQGDVFVEEMWIEDFREVPLSEVTWDPMKDGVSALSFKKRLQKVYSGAAVRMVPGTKVFLGNIRVEYVEDQPMVAIVQIMPRSKAQSIYGQWERWKYVPYTIETVSHYEETANTYKDWNLLSIHEDQVCEIKVYDPIRNRFMILLNGVMMNPIDYPLSALVGTTAIPLAQGKLDPISGFAYSKSQPSLIKVDQAVVDEALMLMIEKTRQSFKPPMGNNSDKVLGSDIFVAGRITNDIKRNQLFPLLPEGARGVTPAEFNFYSLFKQSINEKTVNDVYSGNEVDGQVTATEVMALKEQQLLKLGLAMDGITNLERQLTWLRIHTILTKWTQPIDERVNDTKDALVKIYRTVTTETTLENGEKGIKIFRFRNGGYGDVDDQLAEEDMLTEQNGKETRIVYMDPMMLMKLRCSFFIIINATPKSNDKLSQLLFVQNIRTAIELFGPESLNLEYVKQRFAIMIGENYNKFFKNLTLEQMMGAMSEKVAAGSGANVTPQNAGRPIRAAVAQ